MRLLDCCDLEVLVVAYKEDTTKLKRALEQEGFTARVVRKQYSPAEQQLSASVRCLITHHAAWQVAATREKPSIIVEADFVPSQGFGSMPIPIPGDRITGSLGYLYACGPQIWEIQEQKFARGHAGAMVGARHSARGGNGVTGVL